MRHRLRSEDIYDAILDDDLFAGLPARLAEAYDSRSAMVNWHYSDGTAGVLSHSGYFTDDQLGSYVANFAAMDPWVEAASAQCVHNVAVNLEELVPLHQFEQSSFYNDYIRQMGDDTSRCLGISIANGHGIGTIAIHRGRGQQSFSGELVRSLEQHAADLRRMLSIRGKLAAARQRTNSLELLLDNLPQTTMLVSPDGQLLYVNAPGERFLAAGTVLRLAGGRLWASRDFQTRLSGSIAAACSPEAPSAKSFMLENEKGARWIANAAPFLAPSGARCALLMVHELGGTSAIVVPHLKELFGLSSAEAEIAAQLADGDSPSEIANARGVSVATVRGQLKAIASKLGCHRQAEIVGVVKSATLRI